MWTIAERRAKEDTDVGRFAVEFEIANEEDVIDARRGRIGADQVRRANLKGVVDPGATRLVLPRAVVKQLRLTLGAKVRVNYADRRQAVRQTVTGVRVTLQGRSDVFNAIIEPKRKTALIGAIVLESLDFLVDCTNEKLVPRDPKYIVSEIE